MELKNKNDACIDVSPINNFISNASKIEADTASVPAPAVNALAALLAQRKAQSKANLRISDLVSASGQAASNGSPSLPPLKHIDRKLPIDEKRSLRFAAVIMTHLIIFRELNTNTEMCLSVSAAKVLCNVFQEAIKHSGQDLNNSDPLFAILSLLVHLTKSRDSCDNISADIANLADFSLCDANGVLSLDMIAKAQTICRSGSPRACIIKAAKEVTHEDENVVANVVTRICGDDKLAGTANVITFRMNSAMLRAFVGPNSVYINNEFYNRHYGKLPCMAKLDLVQVLTHEMAHIAVRHIMKDFDVSSPFNDSDAAGTQDVIESGQIAEKALFNGTPFLKLVHDHHPNFMDESIAELALESMEVGCDVTSFLMWPKDTEVSTAVSGFSVVTLGKPVVKNH